MIGIGIPIHNDVLDMNDTDMYEVVCHLIQSIRTHTEDEFMLFVRDNDSLDYRFSRFDITLKRMFGNIKAVFFSDTKKSLTDGWNNILHLATSYGCDAVVLTNQDVIVTKHWQLFIDAIKVKSNDLISPTMSNSSYQPLQMCEESEFVPKDEIIEVPLIQGCCFGAHIDTFKKNMFDTSHFFDPAYKFGYNEVEWQKRNKGRSLVLKNSYVIHMGNYSWSGEDSGGVGNAVVKDRDKILSTFSYSDYLKGG